MMCACITDLLCMYYEKMDLWVFIFYVFDSDMDDYFLICTLSME